MSYEKLEQAARQALEALEEHGSAYLGHETPYSAAISALRQALEQPVSEKGCAECGKLTSDGWALYCVKCSEPVREWVGLTDDEIFCLYRTVWSPDENANEVLAFASAIEAKLKEKNT